MLLSHFITSTSRSYCRSLMGQYSDVRQPWTSWALYCSNMGKQFIRWYYHHIIPTPAVTPRLIGQRLWTVTRADD
ncbi:unnamed protein product [Caenorhabditis auriculariae]|uniref:Uncharacterized protein n=1 Tax=Caenorhabditis auriculariae TaxID=2777116 RepID=A0A8S1HVE2_9PELO|nr:unnamed protein product [Caenorhabditis auriculariae]